MDKQVLWILFFGGFVLVFLKPLKLEEEKCEKNHN